MFINVTTVFSRYISEHLLICMLELAVYVHVLRLSLGLWRKMDFTPGSEPVSTFL